MKKVLPLLLLVMLAGCASNKVTTQYLDGRIVTAEYSDDAIYYQQAAEYGKSRAIDCQNCTPEQRVIIALAAALTDKGFPARGMNGYELAAKISSDVVAVAPYGVLGWAFYRVSKMDTGPKITGEQVDIYESFNPQEVHSTGSDYSPVSVPYRTSETSNYLPVPSQ